MRTFSRDDKYKHWNRLLCVYIPGIVETKNFKILIIFFEINVNVDCYVLTS